MKQSRPVSTASRIYLRISPSVALCHRYEGRPKSKVMYRSFLLRRIRSHPSKSNSCISPPTRKINANSSISELYGPRQYSANNLRSSITGLSVRLSSRLVCTPSVTAADLMSMTIGSGLSSSQAGGAPIFSSLSSRQSTSQCRDRMFYTSPWLRGCPTLCGFCKGWALPFSFALQSPMRILPRFYVLLDSKTSQKIGLRPA